MCLPAFSTAQEDSAAAQFNLEAYAEVYYAYDFNKPPGGMRPGFLYNHARHNEVNVNLAFMRASYTSSSVRATLALMAGNYAQFNLAAEPTLLKTIYEGHAGFKLVKNLWLDAGVFASHIGWESAVSKDCYTLTRSIVAENSPYYESGAKLSWTPGSKWLFSALYLNGWQHIQRPAGNSTPAFGTQVTFKPNPRLTLNYSTFAGNDKPDSARKMRYYNDVFALLRLSRKFGIVAGFDLGLEQKQKDASSYNYWYSPVLILHYAFTRKLGLAARAEYYQDKSAVIVYTGTPNGFVMKGYSLTLDYHVAANALFRIEGRLLESKDRYFAVNRRLSTQNVCLTASFAVGFMPLKKSHSRAEVVF